MSNLHKNTNGVNSSLKINPALREPSDKDGIKDSIKDISDKSNKFSKKYENVNQDQGKQGQLFEANVKNLTEKVLEIIESHHEEQRQHLEIQKAELKRKVQEKLRELSKRDGEQQVEQNENCEFQRDIRSNQESLRGMKDNNQDLNGSEIRITKCQKNGQVQRTLTDMNDAFMQLNLSEVNLQISSNSKTLIAHFIENSALKKALDSIPESKNHSIVKKWLELGPISAQFIIQNTNLFNELACGPNEVEFKKLDKIQWEYNGFVKKGTEVFHGVGRFVSKVTGRVYEGFWKDDKANGFGREIQKDGTAVYTGQFQNDLSHGEGQQIKDNGEVKEGYWQVDKFIGQKNI